MPVNPTPVDPSIIERVPGESITAINIFYRDAANYKMSRDITLNRQLTETEVESLKGKEDSDGMIDLSQTPYENITNIFEEHSLNDDDHPFITVTAWPAKITFDSDGAAQIVVFNECYRPETKPYYTELKDANHFLNCIGIATPEPEPVVPATNETIKLRQASPSPSP